MTDQRDPLDLDLLALADDALDPARRKAIEERLAADPPLAARLAAYREQDRALHARFDPVLAEPIPARLRRFPSRTALSRVAAGAALILIGAAAGSAVTWLVARRGGRELPARAPAPLTALAEQAAIAHVAYAPDARRAVEIAADQEQQLVTWLTKRLGRPVRVPSLADRGLALVGGRLVPGDLTGPAAQFMYQARDGQRATLYVRSLPAREGATAFRVRDDGGIMTFYWADGGWGYALSGSLERSELLAAAREVYQQLGSTR